LSRDKIVFITRHRDDWNLQKINQHYNNKHTEGSSKAQQTMAYRPNKASCYFYYKKSFTNTTTFIYLWLFIVTFTLKRQNWIVVHLYKEAMLGISLYSYP
jgi:hypothetical protein